MALAMSSSIGNIFDFGGSVAPASGPAGGAVSHVFPLRRLWWAAILLLGLSAGAVVWTIWQLRTDAVRAAVSESGNIATVLASQLSRSLQSIDAVLLEVKRSAEDQNIDTPLDFRTTFERREFRDLLIRYRTSLPEVVNIAMADKDGQVVATTASWPTPNINAADRDYFQDARSRHDGQLSTSIPTIGKIDGQQIIVFARRLESSNGNFAGIVFAVVNTKYFADIYGAIQSVHSLLFTLLNPDGRILFRHPDEHDSAGKELSNKAGWLDSLSKGDDGFRILGQADGNVRFVSIRRVPDYPLIVDISVTESTSLATWQQRAAAIGFGSAVFLLFSVYLLRAIARQVRLLSNSEVSLAQKTQQLDAALNNMSQGLTMFDGQQRLMICNGQFAELYALTPEQTKPGTPLQTVLEARVAAGCIPVGDQNFIVGRMEQSTRRNSSDFIDKLIDGRTISITRQPMSNGGWVAIHQDITEQKRIEAQFERMARYDPLTGLANRTLLMEKVNDALARMGRRGEAFAILMLDLDRFKTVNDSLGHPAGDALLKEVARRLRNTTRDVDCVARLGGDEFAIIQASEKDQKNGVIVLSDRILKAVTEPYDLDGRKITLETSIGIALAPQDGTEADALIKNADLALYKAKAEGRNRYCFFEASMETTARERRELEDDMRKAISRDEFELHYQPIVDLEKRECCGAEALVRWRHPERGLVYPNQFIPLAEESGLIVPLGEWILRRACADAVDWPSHLRVAVNLSPAQVKQGEFLELLKSTFNDTGLAPHRLELEITESILLEKNAENLAVLRAIKALGVSIVLDDFGIGYSSMTYLQSFPFDRIKIDQSFIRDMTNQAAGAAIVSAIAGLGRSLDIATTGEGVETVEQLTLLRAAGCRFAQGYLFGRPVPAAELSFELPALLHHNPQAA
jgi:diguanylate cyclase (GGDEF)-like protein